jgi:DNA invertase Pin-like site-specific DNA recombinase
MATDAESVLLAKIDMEERGVPDSLPSPRELAEAGTRCVIAYSRISDLSGKRNDSRRNAKGVTNQHATNRNIARRESLVIIKRYTDNDLSASKDEFRPDFESMLTDLHRGSTAEGYPVHGVITVDEDRIFKTPTQWQRFVEAFRATPDRIFADDYGTQDLYSENAEIIGLLGVAIAMGENRKRRSRTRRWHEGQARRGIAHTGGKAFGYQPVSGSPGEIELVPEEAAVIRKAVAACIEGQSWGSVTKIFIDSGIPTEGGGPWRVQTVKQIVASPRNAGLRLLGGEVFKDEDGQPVIGHWDPIITPAEWEAVTARYMPRQRLPGGNTKDARPIRSRKYLLSGLLRCGNIVDGRICNTVLRANKNSYGAAKYRYSCRPKADGGCAGCSVGGEWIDREISDLVLMALESRPVIDTERPPWEYEEDLTTAVAKRDEFELRWSKGLVPDERFYRLSPQLDEAVAALRKDKAEYEAAGVVPVESAAERRERWSKPVEEGGYDLRQKRAVVFAELTAVLIFPIGKGRKTRTPDSYRPVFKPTT